MLSTESVGGTEQTGSNPSVTLINALLELPVCQPDFTGFE